MLDCKNFMYTTGLKFRMRYQNFYFMALHIYILTLYLYTCILINKTGNLLNPRSEVVFL